VALIRSLILGILVYAAIAVGWPEWTGHAYHILVLSVIAAGSVAVWALHKILDLGEGAAKIGVEIVFLIAIALFVGYTMPQKSGKPPFEQWAAGTSRLIGLFAKR
jgi:hypothetical protein